MKGADGWILLLPCAAGLLGLLGLFLALRAGRRRRLIDNLPTSKTSGVFIGLVEVKGTAEAEEPLVSYLAGQRCVHYSWQIEEHWSRTVTETYKDSKGRMQTRTRHESGWKTVAEDQHQIAFYLRDEAGILRVQPKGARIEPKRIFHTECGRPDPLYYAKGPPHSVSNSDHRRRFVEDALPLHSELYVIGQARERQDAVVAAEIAHDGEAPVFLISTKEERQISRRFGRAFWGWLVLGCLLAVGGVVLWGRALDRPETALDWGMTTGAVYLLVAILGWIWMVFNSLIDLRQRVRRGWSQVEVQLKRRFDLIPRLVQVVTALRDHEAMVHAELAELRGQLAATPPGVAGPDHHGCGSTLLAIQERYPELKANQTFQDLQRALVDAENRIALARGYYNEIATHFNTRLAVVPDGWVARLGRMRPSALMMAEDFEGAPAQVKLVE